MTRPLYILQENDGPLLLNFPHSGTHIPNEIAVTMNERGLAQADTDWHVPELYRFAQGSVTWLQATHSRYVVDLNRDPSGLDLYPGQAGTGICPHTDFEGREIYQSGQIPEVRQRVDRYFNPYHAVLQAQIQRILDTCGYCILLDCHSIRSTVPRLFKGQLPDLNLGTFNGKSCAPELAERAVDVLGKSFSFVHNGRFKGGWITRQYGHPDQSIHGLQLEVSQCAYMDESKPHLLEQKEMVSLGAVLKDLVTVLQAYQPKPVSG